MGDPICKIKVYCSVGGAKQYLGLKKQTSAMLDRGTTKTQTATRNAGNHESISLSIDSVEVFSSIMTF